MTGRSAYFPYGKGNPLFSGTRDRHKKNSAFSTSKVKTAGKAAVKLASMCLIGMLLSRAVILGFLNPFFLAFIVALALNESAIFPAVIASIAGAATLGNSEMLLKCLFSMTLFLIQYAVFRRARWQRRRLIMAAALVANFAAGYLIFYIKNYFLYDILMEGIESILIVILALIFERALPVVRNIQIRRIISVEEVAAFSVLLAFCLVGADFALWGVSFKNCCVILMILLLSYYGSVGSSTAAGIVFGLVQALSGTILPAAIGVYGLCGLMSGIMKQLGRFGAPIGFVLGNALMTYYINGSTEVLIHFNEIAVASLIYLILPREKLGKFLSKKQIMSFNSAKSGKNDKRMRVKMSEQLQDVSEVFNVLSDTLKESALSQEYFSQFDAAQLIEQVVNKYCKDCGLCSNCWKRDFYNSYQLFFNLLSNIENGSVKHGEIPEALGKMCLKPKEIMSCIAQSYDAYKNSLGWRKKVNENRKMISEQLREVSSVVSGLTSGLGTEGVFDEDMEEAIITSLDNAGIMVQEAIAQKSGNGWLVEVTVPGCGGKRECIRRMIPLVNKATGRKFVKADGMCNTCASGQCRLSLKEAGPFQIAAGVGRLSKQGIVSGDNHTMMELRGGKFLLALSDGMGSGSKAAKESNIAMMLLEKLLHAGFDKDVAIKTINALLLLKSTDESYATIDVTVIDQYTGEVEFVKAGAVSTFIRREDRVEIVRSGSLPAGILSHIDAELVRKKLAPGDFVIMITDGILDANKNVLDKESWLADLIAGMSTRNPQRMADEIIDHCLKLNDGQPVDDMTVLVAKIWETY